MVPFKLLRNHHACWMHAENANFARCLCQSKTSNFVRHPRTDQNHSAFQYLVVVSTRPCHLVRFAESPKRGHKQHGKLCIFSLRSQHGKAPLFMRNTCSGHHRFKRSKGPCEVVRKKHDVLNVIGDIRPFPHWKQHTRPHAAMQ